MALPTIDDLLASSYDELRDLFLRRTRWHKKSYDTEDAFHEWCIRELGHWREPSRQQEDQVSLDRLKKRIPLRHWRPPWSYHPHRPKKTPADDPPRPRRRLKKLETFDPMSIAIYAPAEETSDITGLQDTVYSPFALRIVSKHVSKRDLELLLLLRSKPASVLDLANRLEVEESTAKRRLTILGAKIRRLQMRVRRAVRDVLLGKSVFVSSTYSDLHEHRQAVLAKIHKLAANGMPVVVFAMEYMSTGKRHPGKRCLELVKRSNVYVGVFARRYGSIWAKRDTSFTEAEFREAERMSTELAIYIPDPAHAKTLPTDRDAKKRLRLEDLQKYVRANYVVDTFDSPESLASSVHEKLSDLFWKY